MCIWIKNMFRSMPAILKQKTDNRIRIIMKLWIVLRFKVRMSLFSYSIKSLFCIKFRMKFDVMLLLLLNLVQWVFRWRLMKKSRSNTLVHVMDVRRAQWDNKLPNTFQLKNHICLNGYFSMKIWFPGKLAVLKWQR